MSKKELTPEQREAKRLRDRKYAAKKREAKKADKVTADAPKPPKAVPAPVAKKAAKKRVKKSAKKAAPVIPPKKEEKKYDSLLQAAVNVTTEEIMTNLGRAARHIFFAIRALYPNALGVEIREKNFTVVHGKNEK